MRRIIKFIIIITIITLRFGQVTAQSSAPSDLKSDVILECVTFAPDVVHAQPLAVENGTLTGTCSAATQCNIVVCVAGQNCTTFDPVQDINYFGQDNSGLGMPSIKLNSGNNFFSQGEINEKAQVLNGQGHVQYEFYAASQPQAVGAGGEGEDPSQQQGRGVLVFPGGKGTCQSIYWDPYGRVFDASSLEPLGDKEATVTLLDENGNRSPNTLTNNVLIDKMGKYNISINKDGKYKLNVIPKTDHLFTAVEPDIRYKDLYEFIYRAGDVAFEEKAASPKRVDVPLKPKGEPYTRNPDYIYKEYKDVWFEGEAFTKIDLRTVHPKTIIKVMIDGVQLTTDGAKRPLLQTSDKQGYWLALIKKEVLSQEGFNIELIKNPQYYPLAKNNSYLAQLIDKLFSILFKKVSAQQRLRIDDGPNKKVTVVKFEPILDHIEGFAYDSENKRIPKAQIDVRLEMNKQIYFSTVADDTGFFTIYPKNLPPYEFYLEFTDPETQKITTQKTSEFVKQNKEYIKSENLNLIQTTKDNQNEEPLFKNPVSDKPVSDKSVSNPAKTSTSLFNPAIMIILIIITLLSAVTVGLVLYIRRSSG